MIKERRGALARNKPASKKSSESYVIRGRGARIAQRVAQLETHGRASVSFFFPVFLLFLPSFLSLFHRYAAVPASGIEIFT